MIEDEQRTRLWRATSVLAGAVTAGILLAILIAVIAAEALNSFHFLGFGLGFYLLAQGLLVAFVVTAFWFAAHQERMDRRHGAAEEI